MQDIFQVGNAHFAFAPETSAQFVDGGMQFELHTLPVEFDKALHAPAFQPDDVDNPSEGTIAPRFGTYGPFFFYDKTGEAHRVVRAPQTKPATHDFHLYERGFAWDRFEGEVTLTPSFVEIRGVMKAYSGDGADSIPIHVRKSFEPGEVALKPHTYTSLAEAAEVPPERVQRLLIEQPWERGTPKFDVFPPEILRFSRLEFLSLQFAYPEYAPFTALPDAFCALDKLKELYIRCSSIVQLPDNFGALAQLEVLSMEYGKLERLPDSICNLARLQRLLLNGNALDSLPECIGDLPALRLLAVEKNPFVSLPASLKKIEKVNLERKLQALYQDIAYRKDVDVPVAPAQFLAQGDDLYAQLLAAACGKHKLKRYLPALLRVARRTVRYRTTEPEDYAQKGNTRFGGAPDLPPGMAFPLSDGDNHWRFYAQLNLAEVAPLQPYLPRERHAVFLRRRPAVAGEIAGGPFHRAAGIARHLRIPGRRPIRKRICRRPVPRPQGCRRRHGVRAQSVLRPGSLDRPRCGSDEDRREREAAEGLPGARRGTLRQGSALPPRQCARVHAAQDARGAGLRCERRLARRMDQPADARIGQAPERILLLGFGHADVQHPHEGPRAGRFLAGLREPGKQLKRRPTAQRGARPSTKASTASIIRRTCGCTPAATSGR
jgi:hypothetical protein